MQSALSETLPVSIQQWPARLQHRAAVSALVARVKSNFHEEHELGTNFKYWVLETLPPVVSARFLLRVITLKVPYELRLHLVDALTLQFAVRDPKSDDFD